MHVHLIDGTYELFRHFFAVPSSTDIFDQEIGALRGVVASIVGMIESGATHLGVATDHVVESFRNDLYTGYKTGEGIDPELRSQFEPLENALEKLGVAVWPMVDQEADDAMAAAAGRASRDERVERVWICTPDKDLAQCVVGDRVVQLDRRKELVRNRNGVREKFGVDPESIPDLLALMGDTADGFPGLPGWGAKSAGTVLGRYAHLEDIPQNHEDWDVKVRGAPKLAATLAEQQDSAMLFRDLATLRTDAPVFDSVDELLWKGPLPEFEALCESMKATRLWERAVAVQTSRHGA
jgi:5'-3' exonuclease